MKFLVFLLIVCQNLFAWSFFGTPDTLRANKKVAAPYGDFDSISVDSIITGNITADTLKSSAISFTTTETTVPCTLKSYYYTSIGELNDTIGDISYRRIGNLAFISIRNILCTINKTDESTDGRVKISNFPYLLFPYYSILLPLGATQITEGARFGVNFYTSGLYDTGVYIYLSKESSASVNIIDHLDFCYFIQ